MLNQISIINHISNKHVGKGLSHYDKDQTLPRWKTVIGLTPEQSKSYQDFAKVLAKHFKTSRVHLDIILWRGERVGELRNRSNR